MTLKNRVIRAGSRAATTCARPSSATAAALPVLRCGPPGRKPGSLLGDGWAGTWPRSALRRGRRYPRRSCGTRSESGAANRTRTGSRPNCSQQAPLRRRPFKSGALGRRVTVTGVDFVLRPQPTIYLPWALGNEETRRLIEAAHERAIERMLEWIEDEVAVIRYGTDDIYRVRPVGRLGAARLRHHEAHSGRPLLRDHLLLLLSVKG
ncbi:relaxase domain-containing protein [Streptomyces sp. NPDC002181]|uniref:relaxase domain-containing protein n=1 Tax=Streptomyces sp. NPDC002181 TaxID=3364635 RepID=UPI00369CB5F3